MKITSSAEYAVRLVVALARADAEAAIPAERLSESENVPFDYVNQLLLRLRRAGIVASQRGSGGGYALSRPPAEISLGQVLRAVEGRVFEDVCERFSRGARDCHHQGGCSISPVWQRLARLIEGYFDSLTVADILAEAPAPCEKFEALKAASRGDL